MARLAPLLATAAALTLTACGGGDQATSNGVEFCRYASEQTSMIVAPPLSTEAELDATLEFYRLMGQLAPQSIARQWNDLVVSMETASSIVPGNPESEQAVALTAYATERSAYEVKVWIERNCGVVLPITTIAPHDPIPAVEPDES
ncbi:MAG: hypothetical protein CSA55_02950 [Ilumatobacter coccineus]|uniref:Lipoprotein n=1 Tax=Ilumatobacter coccineus TaxID=467094 RepID=A0A2G6KAU6_9ACTN|nr:MAG: hypothetical protein CSA55_02950 [Ilumatobacter coccineus]